tara:strand:+ start:1786 stop:2301 length:516 start_codon:yes stop_codon:yes gene_type:complete
MKNFLSLTLYYLIFTRLPNSRVPIGRFFNTLRIFILKGFISIGKNNTIQTKVYFGSGKNIKIGNNCQINDNVRLDNVTIKNNVMIARDTIILGKSHKFKSLDIPMNLQGVDSSKKTTIEDDVWIGLRAVILPGVKISKGTIIGACSLVNKDTEPYGIYAGIPAKLIKRRNI